MDRARQAASWEGELERGSTELVGKLSGRWICGMGQEGQQVGKIIAWQFQEEEVDRRVTGRISKDLETFKQESGGWGRRGVQEGTPRGTGWPMSGGCTVALRRVQSIGDAMSALLSLHFFSTLHTTQNQKRCLKVVSKFCKIKKQTQL